MSLPVRSALPPAGRASVAPQIEQAIEVDALSKIMASLPQSRQLTRRNLPAIISPQSFVDQFELPGALPGRRVCLSGLLAPVDQVDALGRLLPRWLRSWETTVSRGNPTEAALPPLQLASTSLLDALDRVLGVLTSRGAVALHRPWHLHHVPTSRLATARPPMTRL